MLKLFFKFVIPLALMLTVFLVGYNYYWGTDAEKQQSKEIVSKFTDLGSDVVNLLRSEKDKYDDGKFDDALAKISARIAQLKKAAATATDGGQALMDQVNELDEQKTALESQLGQLKSSSGYGDNINSSSDAPSSNQAFAPAGNRASVDDLGARIEALAAQAQQVSARFEQ